MMQELTPGLHVTDYVTAGAIYVIDTTRVPGFGEPMRSGLGGGAHLSGLGGGTRAILIADADWQRIPAADRERLLRHFTSLSALNGITAMRQWLASKVLA